MYIFTIFYNDKLIEIIADHPGEIPGEIYVKYGDPYPKFTILEVE